MTVRHVLSLLVPLTLLAALAGGCGLFFGAPEALEDAHMVTLTDATCAYVVVKTQGERFGVLAPAGPVPLRQGDLLVGILRQGEVALRRLPFPEQIALAPEAYDVRAAGVPLASAQMLWRELCPPARVV